MRLGILAGPAKSDSQPQLLASKTKLDLNFYTESQFISCKRKLCDEHCGYEGARW